VKVVFPPSTDEDEPFLTVDEAALALNRSVATVRRWCQQGRLAAQRVGRQWLVQRQAVEQLKPRGGGRKAQPGANVDLQTALRHIKSVDLGDRDIMVPDILRFQDQLADPAAIMAGAAGILAGEIPIGSPQEVELPKSAFFTRTALMLGIEERLAYQAAIASFADRVDSALSPVVYGGRRSTDSNYFLKPSKVQWRAWRSAVKADLEGGYSWMVKTDITAYFDSLQHHNLLAAIESQNPDPKVLDALKRMLRAWAIAPAQGIPQGPNASRFLQNLYFVPIDQEMVGNDWHYYRYTDDIRIVGRTRSEALRGLQALERACRKRGLLLSAQKTKLLEGESAIKDWDDEELDKADYLMESWNHKAARKLLHRIVGRAIRGKGNLNARDAKFSLWRLTQLRDTNPLKRVLACLEDLAPLSSVVALYLRPFFSKKSVRQIVQKGLAEFFNDDDRNGSASLCTWLLAALLDASEPPTEELLAYVRSVSRNKNLATYLRIFSVNVLARAKKAADIDWIRDQVRSEYDPGLVRGYLVALARAGALDSATSGRATGRIPALGRTVKYLKERSTSGGLPSILSGRSRWLSTP
jgi:excisionase family DNA binding protein